MRHRVLCKLPFSKCPWDVTSDWNLIKISKIHTDHLTYVTYDNYDKLQKLNMNNLCRKKIVPLLFHRGAKFCRLLLFGAGSEMRMMWWWRWWWWWWWWWWSRHYTYRHNAMLNRQALTRVLNGSTDYRWSLLPRGRGCLGESLLSQCFKPSSWWIEDI